MRELTYDEVNAVGGGILAAGYSGGTYTAIDGVWGAAPPQFGPSPRYYAVQAARNAPPEERRSAVADYLGY